MSMRPLKILGYLEVEPALAESLRRRVGMEVG